MTDVSIVSYYKVQVCLLENPFDISENTHLAAAEDGCTSNTSLHAADQCESPLSYFHYQSSVFIVDERLSTLARFLANSDDLGHSDHWKLQP